MIHAPVEAERNTRNAVARTNKILLSMALKGLTDGGLFLLNNILPLTGKICSTTMLLT